MTHAHPDRDIACPACGLQTAHRFLFRKNGCEILCCSQCGLGRAVAGVFDPGAYYTGGYFSGGHADGYADYLGSEPVLRREFAREVRFLRGLGLSGRLIEIGCAYGFFLKEATPHFDVAGVELAEDASAHARASGLDVITGEASEEALARFGRADVFVLFDVIEHLADPFGTLTRLAGHLAPGGVILLTTGDFASPLARLTGANWRLMTPPQHLWYLTSAAVRRWAARHAMRIERVDHPWKIVPLSLIAYQAGRAMGVRMNVAAGGRVGLPVNLFDAMRIVLRRAP